MAPAFIMIDDKRYLWRDILKLRREQLGIPVMADRHSI